MPRLLLSRRAAAQIDALPPDLRDAVLTALLRLRADPTVTGKELRGRMRGTWVARVGSYRILYTVEGDDPSATVVVRAVLHRAVAYRQP